MLSSFMARRASTVISSVTKSLTGSSSFIGAFPVNYYGSPEPSQQLLQHQQQQIRWVTKKRQHRQIKRQRKAELATRGIFPPKPYNYIPKDTPVLNAIPKEERLQESKQLDELAAKELQNKMEQIQSSSPLMRFHLYGDHLQMSERVKKLFDLHNGNQQEVVRAQKQRGMELFQRREGDTGSSAVQVIALTTRIQQIQTHLRKHNKDKHSKRGLDALYVRRRKVLDYMERKDFDSYRNVVKTLGLTH